MNCHVEWIRNFLLRKSTIFSSNSISNNFNHLKSQIYSDLSTYRYQLLKTGFQSFINHKFYSLTISIIDSNFPYMKSNFSIIRSYLLNFLPDLNISINELEGNNFSPSHYTLCKSILIFYIRFHLKPSSISPTCYGLDIESYERSFYEWGRSICQNENLHFPGNFLIDFGTAQIVAIILFKIHPELIRLNQITFSLRLTESEIIKNWREVGTALSVIGVHVPTEKEWCDKLCLLCFAVDLFKAIYNKSKKSSVVEYTIQQNRDKQRQQQSAVNCQYRAIDEINKIDFLINQMNSISNGNPNILLSNAAQSNPIIVQEQKENQQVDEYQRLKQLIQQRMEQPIQTHFNQPIQKQFDQPDTNISMEKFNSVQPEITNIQPSRVKITSNRKIPKDSNHCESTKYAQICQLENKEMIFKRAEKFKLLKELPENIQSDENKKSRKSPSKNNKEEVIKNYKIMSSFAIDPSFPNQCKLTTYSENQLNGIKKHDKHKHKKKIECTASPNSQTKCSYVTFDNYDDQSNLNQNKKRGELYFKESIEKGTPTDKLDYETDKETKNHFTRRKKEGNSEFSMNDDKSGSELIESIDHFINKQSEAQEAASFARKILKSQFGSDKKSSEKKEISGSDKVHHMKSNSKGKHETRITKPNADKETAEKSKKESMKHDTEKIEPTKIDKSNKKKPKNSSNVIDILDINEDKTGSITNTSKSNLNSSKQKDLLNSELNEILKRPKNNLPTISDPLIEISSNQPKKEKSESSKNENKDFNDPFSSSSSDIKRNSSISKKTHKSDTDKSDPFDDSNSVSKNKSELNSSHSQKCQTNNENSENKSSSQIVNNIESNQPSIDNESMQHNSMNIDQDAEQLSSLIDSRRISQNAEKKKSDISQINLNQSSFSQFKNSHQLDEFSMRDDLTFPDIPSLIGQSFHIEQSNPKEEKNSDFSKFDKSSNNADSSLNKKGTKESFFHDESQSSNNFPIKDENSENSKNSKNFSNMNSPITDQSSSTHKANDIKSQHSKNSIDSNSRLNIRSSVEDQRSQNLKKRPIPIPPSHNSKISTLPKSNSQKSDSLTPADLSIFSSLEGDNKENTAVPNSFNKKMLNDDNELSIDQNSSEIRFNQSNSNGNSQSSTKVESAVEDFIPEIEKNSSRIETNNKPIHNLSASTNKTYNASIKKSTSSSSSDSIPFKIINSDSENKKNADDSIEEDNINNKEDNINNKEENINNNEDSINNKEEDSKHFKSVIEEFDLSSIKSTKSKKKQNQSLNGPIQLHEDPVPKGDENKGRNSETRRVSFSVGVKGFGPSSSQQQQFNNNISSSGNSSLQFNDVDTFMSTGSLSQTFPIPIEERLKMYSKEHNELSLEMSEKEPEIIREYRDISTANFGNKYICLSKDELSKLEQILPLIKPSSESNDIINQVSKELKLPKNNSAVRKISANIRTFLLSRGNQQ